MRVERTGAPFFCCRANEDSNSEAGAERGARRSGGKPRKPAEAAGAARAGSAGASRFESPDAH